MIGDALGISHNTVKDWERATSNGPDPRIPGLLEQLEAYLELPEGGLRERTAEPIKLNEEERKIMNTTTDFQKQQIMECYERLRKFVSDMDIEDENVYYDIRNMIEVKKIALPTAVYKAMMNFMDQVVEPYVFEDTTEIFSEEEAKRNEKGIVEIKSEQAFQKLMVRFMEKLSELDAKIETCAETNYPVKANKRSSLILIILKYIEFKKFNVAGNPVKDESIQKNKPREMVTLPGLCR